MIDINKIKEEYDIDEHSRILSYTLHGLESIMTLCTLGIDRMSEQMKDRMLVINNNAHEMISAIESYQYDKYKEEEEEQEQEKIGHVCCSKECIEKIKENQPDDALTEDILSFFEECIDRVEEYGHLDALYITDRTKDLRKLVARHRGEIIKEEVSQVPFNLESSIGEIEGALHYMYIDTRMIQAESKRQTDFLEKIEQHTQKSAAAAEALYKLVQQEVFSRPKQLFYNDPDDELSNTGAMAYNQDIAEEHKATLKKASINHAENAIGCLSQIKWHNQELQEIASHVNNAWRNISHLLSLLEQDE